MQRLLAPLLVLSAFGGGCGTSDSIEERPPDIFLIVIDTLRADRMSAYGWPRPTTPNLSKLAVEGTRFADVTSQCSWTKPSMVSMWTGQYITAYQDKMHDDQPNLPEALQYLGYKTVGVAGNVLLSEVEGFGRGFDHYDARRLTKKERRRRSRAGGEGGPCRNGVELIQDFLAPIDDFLEANQGVDPADRQPLFAYLNPMEPHAPYLARLNLKEALPEGTDIQRLPSEWHQEQWGALGQRAPRRDPGWKDTWAAMELDRIRYERELLFLDRLLGQLFDNLTERGILDDAVIIIAADHGEGMFDHPNLRTPKQLKRTRPNQFFHMQHGENLFQELVGTPLIFWGRGVSPDHVVKDPVENLDIFPTLLEMCGLPPSNQLHGRSLMPYLRREQPQARESVHSFVHSNVMVREVSTNMKLIVPTQSGIQRGAKPGLYNLTVDPLERMNLYETDQESTRRLAGLLERWKDAYPTRSTDARLKDPTTFADLRDLGYLGGDEEEEEQD